MYSYEESEVVEFGKWVCVQPINSHTGCGIIVDVVDTREHLVQMGYSEESYIVQTDFGNTFTLTKEEMETVYHPVRVEEDPMARMIRQQELLKGVLDKFYKEL